jgi:hypothetical protein
MAISRLRIIRFALAAFVVAINGIPHPQGECRSFLPLMGYAARPAFAETALSLPSAVTQFSDMKEKSAEVRLIHSAAELLDADEPSDGKRVGLREPRPDVISAFPKPHRRDPSPSSRRVDPKRVQELVQNTQTRREAFEILRRDLGWPNTPDNLSAYLANHNITAPWRTGPHIEGHRVSPQHIQELLDKTRTRDEAVAALRKEFHWPKRANTLSVFVARHKLKTRWRSRGRDHAVRSSA